MVDRDLLMIPGPVEVSPAVLEAAAAPPPSHTAPGLIDAFGTCLERMRRVWRASAESQPFVVAGGGTVAMEMAAANLVEPGERAVVVVTGYFGDRMAEMLRRQGAEVATVTAPVGDAPAADDVARALAGGSSKALFVTHVDTSTGVRIDPEPLARLAREAGALSVFDGVCATGGERFDDAEAVFRRMGLRHGGTQEHARLHALATGICNGLPKTVATTVLIIDQERHWCVAIPLMTDVSAVFKRAFRFSPCYQAISRPERINFDH